MAKRTSDDEQLDLDLVQFDKTNTQAGRDEQARLSCTLKAGVFRMNKHFVAEAKANAGSQVVLLQDKSANMLR